MIPNNADNRKSLHLLCAFIFLTAMVFCRINDGAIRGLKHTDNSTSSSALEHKIGANDAGTIWIVNQPKCGTGSLVKSFALAFQCQKLMPLKINRCSGGKMVKRSHDLMVKHSHDLHQTEKIKKAVEKEMERWGTKPDRCIVITAIRDPILAIPSHFFENNKKAFCDGTQSEEEIIEKYKKFLLGPAPGNQVKVTAETLRAFGAYNISEAMELLSEEGYTFFNQPEENGPWAGCELLFLQIDYDESNSNLDKGLDHAVEGVKMKQYPGRIDLCPKAEDNYRAVKNYRISDELIGMYSKNTAFRDVYTYYRNNHDNTQRRKT